MTHNLIDLNRMEKYLTYITYRNYKFKNRLKFVIWFRSEELEIILE